MTVPSKFRPSRQYSNFTGFRRSSGANATVSSSASSVTRPYSVTRHPANLHVLPDLRAEDQVVAHGAGIHADLRVDHPPSLIRACGDGRNSLTGIANPRPIEPPFGASPAVLMPMTSTLVVDQRTTGVTGVDRGVGLDGVDDRVGVGRLVRTQRYSAIDRADDPAA